jgi:hypothetical protein
MKFCCQSFSRLADGIPRKGFAIHVCEHDGEPVFFLQFRSLDRLVSLPKGLPIGQLIVATETRVLFCPWCGCNLGEFYLASWRELYEVTRELTLDGDHRRGGGSKAN